MRLRLVLTAFLVGHAFVGLAGQTPSTTIRMMGGSWQGIPPKEASDFRSISRRAIFEEFHRQNPDVTVVNAGGLEIVGGTDSESAFLMSMAGDTAPDVFYVNFRQYYQYIDEGFCRPLDDLIARDPGMLGRVNPAILRVVKSYDGHVYAIPFFQAAQALWYRRDMFRAAGLDPGKPPRTWDEFYRDGQRLCESRPGLSGFAFGSSPDSDAYWWIDFLWQAGGEAVVPSKSGPWRAAIDSPQGAVALDFYRKLVKDTWVGPGGKTYGPVATLTPDINALKRADKVAMWFDYTNDLVLANDEINPANVGVAALPAGPAGHQNEINAGMWAINAAVTDPKKLDACWRFIKYFAGDAAARVNVKTMVDQGYANLCNPVYLRKFGYSDALKLVDPAYVRANEEDFQTGHPEPYGRNCQQVYTVMGDALDRARLETTPSRQILHDVALAMDQKLLGYVPPGVMAMRRQWAAGIFAFALCVVVVATIGAARWGRRHTAQIVERLPAGANRHRVYRFVAALVLPAALTIFVWAYLPLARGLVIAFQDYHVVGATRWVGLDNFISVFTSPMFYTSIVNSLVYVGLTIAVGFCLPICLALVLDEIPIGRSLFRTIYFLPAMTSGLVIALLWKQLYDKAPTGLLNELLLPIIHGVNEIVKAVGWAPIRETHDWLGDPSLAMFAVVLPGVWAAAGPGSLLYSAALKNVPNEFYEAADLDGAKWWQKLWAITLPGLKPLILINLLGVFIGSFKSFDNIFALTMGGPLNATHTMGLEIWQNAFMFLKFGYATAAAWVMGGMLAGFTLIQVRSLLRMRFTTAEV
ncbi:MAG: extracellular solute-binding protein [Fimbriimonadaceae bacterium]